MRAARAALPAGGFMEASATGVVKQRLAQHVLAAHCETCDGSSQRFPLGLAQWIHDAVRVQTWKTITASVWAVGSATRNQESAIRCVYSRHTDVHVLELFTSCRKVVEGNDNKCQPIDRYSHQTSKERHVALHGRCEGVALSTAHCLLGICTYTGWYWR